MLSDEFSIYAVQRTLKHGSLHVTGNSIQLIQTMHCSILHSSFQAFLHQEKFHFTRWNFFQLA